MSKGDTILYWEKDKYKVTGTPAAIEALGERFIETKDLRQQVASLSAEVERLKGENAQLLEAAQPKQIEVNIGAAIAALQDNPALGEMLMSMVAPAAAEDVANAEARAETAEREAAELREALKPFAEAGRALPERPVQFVFARTRSGEITSDHLRRAAALVAGTAGRGEG